MSNASFGAIWCEATADAQVRIALPALAKRGIRLHLAWHVGRDRFSLLSAAKSAGVQVNPWLLMPHGMGYWATVHNANRFTRYALELMQRWVDAGHEPTTFIVDLEPEFERVMALESALSRPIFGMKTALQALRRSPPLRLIQTAERTFTRFVAKAHHLGWPVHLSTLPFVVDGDSILGLSVGDADWDRISIQVYRTLFAQMLGRYGERVFGPHLVQSYGESARAEFGDRAGLDLGLVGSGVFPAAIFKSPGGLSDDLGAARAAQISVDACTIFDLRGMLDRGPIESWLDILPGSPPAPDLGTRWLRRGIRLYGRWTKNNVEEPK